MVLPNDCGHSLQLIEYFVGEAAVHLAAVRRGVKYIKVAGIEAAALYCTRTNFCGDSQQLTESILVRDVFAGLETRAIS